MKTAAGVFVAAAGINLPGCGGNAEPPIPPAGTGTVRGIVTGLGSSALGGSITVSDGTQTRTVPMPAPVGGTSTGDVTGVPPGSYTVSYTPPSGFELVDASQSPRTVVVVADQIQQITVACQAIITTGTIHVAVTGLTGAASGGAVSARLSNNTGPTFAANLPAPSGGGSSADLTAVPPGSYAVTYAAPSGFELTNPATSPLTVTVAVGAVVQAAFAAQVSVTTGTIRVTAAGLTGAATGGAVSARLSNNTGPTFAANLPAPVGGSSSADLTAVPPGSYAVTYTAPAGFELTNPATSPLTVAVTVGAVTPAAFAAQASVVNGSIQVTVTGLGSAATGGAVSAIKSDNTGPTFTANLPAPTSGSSTATLAAVPPGSYAVTYTAPSGFQLTTAGQSPQTVTVASGAAAPANFTCQVASTVGLLFASDWSTGLGATDAALRDTGKAKPWTSVSNLFNVVDVIAATGLGFPAGMANVLRVRHLATQVRAGGPQATSIWPVPNVGDSLFFRVYLRNAIADNQGDLSSALNAHHPIEPEAGTCAFAHQWTFASKADGTFPITFNTLQDPTFAHTRWRMGKPTQTLPKNQTYRLEWRITRVATGYTVSVRIFNQANTLLFDDANIWDANSATTLSTQPILTMTNTCLDRLFVGTNGPASFNGVFNADQFHYFGGVMVRGDTWCGPY